MRPDLNDRQRRFAELVVEGLPAGRAYEQAGYSARGASADNNASRLLGNARVSEYLSNLRKEAMEASKMTRESKLEMLYRIATEQEKTNPRAAIAAIAEENRMTGGYEPEKQESDLIIRIGGDA